MRIKRFLILAVALILTLWLPMPASAVQYKFDSLNRLIEARYDDGQKANYEYDSGGNILKVTHFDPNDPTVSITSPADNSQINEALDITVDANDNVAVTKVEFYGDDIYIGESTTAPFTYNWLGSIGDHILIAKAYDADGNVGTSVPINVRVTAKVIVTAPADGSVVSGIISSFSATSNEPLTGDVELYIDGEYKKSVVGKLESIP